MVEPHGDGRERLLRLGGPAVALGGAASATVLIPSRPSK
jgi:hypothetical protein